MKNSKEIRKVIHHILGLKGNTLKADTTALNKFFNSFMTEVSTYRNQSTDLPSKSMDWFLYDKNLNHERINETAERQVRINPANHDAIISHTNLLKTNTNSFK